MLSLCLLLLAVILLSGVISMWLSDADLTDSTLRHSYSLVISAVLFSFLFDLSLITAIPFSCFFIFSIPCAIALLFFRLRRSWPFSLTTFPALRASLSSIIVMGLISYLSFMFIPHSGRWGRWDARAIWTLHARFMVDQNHWRNMFAPSISWTHADYPLMLSSLIAMCWKALGANDAVLPCVIAYVVFVLILLATYSGLKEKTNPLLATLALIAFAFTPMFAKVAAFQGADTMLSLFILMAIISAHQSEAKTSPKLLFVAGFIAGFTGWIKNEGLAFTLIFSIGMLWHYRRSLRSLLPYLAGLTLPITIIVIFKICYAPSNDIIHAQGHNTLSQLTDLSRYKLIATFFTRNFRLLYPIPIIIAALIILRGYERILDIHLFILLAMLGVYIITFLITPRDLQWHLETASERLFIQLFPAFVYVLLSLLGNNRLYSKTQNPSSLRHNI